MSRSRRKDLGLSTREYEEAIILERIFHLTKRNRCSTCLVRKCSHVDPDRYKLLCGSCASRCKFKIHIGTDHLPMSVLEQLESVYGKHKAQKSPVNSKSQGRKTASHRHHHHHHRSHSTSSSQHSVETQKHVQHQRRPKRLDSTSTDEDDHNRSSMRYKSHDLRRSVSSGSSFDGRRSKTYEELKSITPKPRNHRQHPFDEHRPRKDNYDRIASDYHVSPPSYGSAEHHHQVHTGWSGKSHQRKDPYGYEMPVADDMPGMVGIMARDQTAVSRQTHHLAESGWPVVDRSANRESDNRMNRHREHYFPATNDRLNVRPDNFVEDRPVMRGNAISSSTREGRSNPFARSDVKYTPDVMNRNRVIDNVVDRFNMSSMRLALQPQLGSQTCGIDDAFQGVEPPMRNGRRYVADYGGIYDGRGTR